MQLNLPMLTVYDGPRLVDPSIVEAINTYREAVRTCWDLRTRTNLTKRQLAMEAGLYASHVSDYLSEDTSKRELPARGIAEFEVACGNRVITQYQAARSHVTLLEQFIPQRRMA